MCAVIGDGQVRGDGLHDRAEFDHDGQVLRVLLINQPVAFADKDRIAGEGVLRPYDDLIFRRFQGDDVERFVVFADAAADAQPFTLADGVMDDAVMLANDASVDMDDVAGVFGLRAYFFDYLCIVAVGDEANVL